MVSKAMLVVTVLMVVGVPLFAEGARELKDEPAQKAADVHPENFFGGVGVGSGFFPTPGGVPVFGAGSGIGVGPDGSSSVNFCSIPGLGCVSVQPTNPGGGASTGSGSSTPLPFP